MVAYSRLFSLLAFVFATMAVAQQAQAQSYLDVGKSISPGAIGIGETGTVTYTLTNTNGSGGTSIFDIQFSESFPANIQLEAAPNVTENCAAVVETYTFPSGGVSMSVALDSSGSPNEVLAPGDSCSISFDITATASGSYTLTSGPISYDGQTPLAGVSVPLTVSATPLSVPLIAKEFVGGTAQPGQIVPLTFTLTNDNRTETMTSVSFSDDLNAMLAGTVAVGLPLNNVCGSGSSISGAGQVTLSNGVLPPSSSCSFGIQVQIPGGAPAGTVTNTTGPATASLGGAAPAGDQTATDNLNIQVPAGGDFQVSKSITPSTIFEGNTARVTYSLDNSSSVSSVGTVSFSETLPAGVTIGSPANLVTNCTGGSSQTFSVPDGGNSLSLFLNGFNFAGFESFAPGESCTFAFDVKGVTAGNYLLSSGQINVDGTNRPGASVNLTVNPAAPGAPQISKSMSPFNVDPGGTVDVTFELFNPDRTQTMTGLTFSDDLNAMLAGATAIGTPLNNICGAGSSFSGTSNLVLSGGTLGPGETCTFTVQVQIPSSTPNGIATNVTSAAQASLGGAPLAGTNAASANINVQAAQSLNWSRAVNPGISAPGSTATFTYTISNPNSVAVTNGAFSEPLSFLPETTVYTGSTAGCGGASISSFNSGGATGLQVAGIDIPAAGTCTITVNIPVPTDANSGSFGLLTSELTSTFGGSSLVTAALPGTFVVEGGANISLSKSFNDIFDGNNDGVVADGAQVEMNLLLSSATESPNSATAISFSDDLNAFSAGTTATITSNTCGGTVAMSAGNTLLSASGITVGPGASCTITALLTIAGASGGSQTNTISDGTYTAGATTASINAASASLVLSNVAPVILTHAYSPTQALPGSTGQVTYTFKNPNASHAATGLLFTHNLGAVLPGLVNTGVANDTCGFATSGTSLVISSGGTIAAGETCVLVLNLSIPANAVSGNYSGATGDPTATVNGSTVFGSASNAILEIQAEPLILSQSIAPNPAASFDNLTLTYTIENPLSQAVNGIAFAQPLTNTLPVTGLAVSSNSCGGAANVGAVSGATGITLSGGSLSANTTCQIEVSMTVAGGTADNTYVASTFEASGTTASGSNIGSNPTNTALSVVNSVNTGFNLTFSNGGNVSVGGTISGTYTITNTGSTNLDTLKFAHDLGAAVPGMVAANLPLSGVCGGAATVTGSGTVSFDNGALASGTSCQFTVLFSIPATATPGTVTSATSDLTAQGLFVTAAASDDLIISPAADIAVSLTNGTTSVTAGQSTTYTAVVSNNGPSADPSVGAVLGFPDTAGCSVTATGAGGAAGFANAGPAVTAVNQTLSLPAGASVTYTAVCSISPTASGNVVSSISATNSVTDPFPGNNLASDTDPIGQSADLSVTLSDSTDPIFPGGSTTLTVAVFNAGPSAAVNTVSTLTLPTGLALVSTSGCSEDPNGAPTCSLGTIAPGGNTSYTVNVTAENSATGGQTSQVSVASNATDPLTGNNSANETTTVTPQADLAVTVDDGATSVVAGTSSTYAIVFTNNGPSAISSVNLLADMSQTAGCTVTASSTGGATGASNPAGSGLTSVSQNVSMPAGATVTYSAVCSVAPNATGNLVVSAAYAGSSTNDPVAANNTASDNNTAITQSADLSVTLGDSPDPVLAAQNVTLTAIVANAGPSDAANAVATVILPAGLTLVSTSGCAEDPNGVPTCSLGTIAASGNASISIVATAGASGGSVSTTASVASDASDPVNTNNSATENTTITAAADIQTTMTDSATTVIAGETTTYSTVFTNAGPSADPAVAISLSYPGTAGCTVTPSSSGGATGASAPGAAQTVVSQLLSMPAGSTVTYAAVCNIAPNATGTLSVSSSAKASVSETVPSNNVASDTDTVITSNHDLSITKTDGVTNVLAGSTLTYTIVASNDGPSDATGVTVTDTFPSGLTCSTSSVSAGGASGATSGFAGNISETIALPTGASVTYTASCQVSPTASGTLSNTANIGGGNGSDPVAGNNAATDADTSITPAQLGFSKVFSPTSVNVGETSVLTLTIDNSTNTSLAATGLTFTDNLPSGMQLDALPNASTTCTGGTLSATAGSGTLSLSGATVAAGATCTVTATVVTTADGSLTNITSDLTSNFPNAGSAIASLAVNPAGAPTFAKAFADASIAQGTTTTLTFTVDNTANAVAANGMSFTDTFPAGMVVAPTPAVSNTCGGTFSATAGAGSVTLSGGVLAASATCTLSVDVRALGSGALVNTAGDLTSNLPTANGPSATLQSDASTMTFGQSFAAATILQGQDIVVSFAIDNTANAIEANNIAFSNTLSGGLIVASSPSVSNTCGGTVTATAGGGSISLSGGTIAAGGQCLITVNLNAPDSGTINDSTSPLTSTLATVPAASATLNVSSAGILEFAQSFNPASVAEGDTSVLSFAITNPNFISADGLAFTNTLPTGVTVAANPSISSTCGGTFNASAGASSLTFTGGSVAPQGSCEISVTVLASASGTLNNVTSDLTSTSVATTPAASAQLDVAAAGAPGFSIGFAPASITQGQTTVLSYVIDNSANGVVLSNGAFAHTLPGGVSIASAPNLTSNCGGSVAATAGGTSVTLSGGTIPIGQTCTVSLEVVAATAGTISTTTGDLTSSLPTSPGPSATLVVAPAPAPGFAKTFADAQIAEGAVTTLTLSVDNSGALVDATNLAFIDNLPAEMVVAATPNASTTCTGGTVTATGGATSLSLTGGTVLAGATCEVVVNVRAAQSGTSVNVTDDLTSSLGNSGTATATLEIIAANGPAFSKVFTPSSISQGFISTLTYTIDNSDEILDASALAFTDTLPAGLTVAAVPDASTTCSGASLSATAGGSAISLAAGAVLAGESCTVSVDVTSSTTGTVSSVSGPLSSSVATGGTAEASLTVTAAPAPTLSHGFQPAQIVQGGQSALVFTIDNSNSGIAAGSLGLNVGLTGAQILALSGSDVTNTCGGALVANGSGGFALSGGGIDAGGSCTISVPVTSSTIGQASINASLSSSLGSGTLSTSQPLDVIANPNGQITIVQLSDEDTTFNFSSSESALNFSINTANGSGAFGPVTLVAGTYVITQESPSGFGNVSLTCSDNNSTTNPRQGQATVQLGQFENVTCTYSSINSARESAEVISDFLHRRNNLILSNRPSRDRRHARISQGIGTSQHLAYQNGDIKSFAPVNFNLLSAGSGNYSVSTSLAQVERARMMFLLAHDGDPDYTTYLKNRRFDIWFEAHYNRFEGAGDSGGHFGIAYLGADYLINKDLLAGIMLQFDSLDDENPTRGSRVEGHGWMVGPYVTARVAPNLIFDGRLAWGKSDNDITLPTSTGNFDTERFLIDLNLTGNFDWNDWVISPNLSVAYIEDRQEAYVNSLNALVPSQKASLGQIRLGPTFSTSYVMGNGTLVQPSFTVTGIYNFANASGQYVSNNAADETDGFRGRIEGKVRMTNKFGSEFSFGANYDGIGQPDFESWGLTFNMHIPLE